MTLPSSASESDHMQRRNYFFWQAQITLVFTKRRLEFVFLFFFYQNLFFYFEQKGKVEITFFVVIFSTSLNIQYSEGK